MHQYDNIKKKCHFSSHVITKKYNEMSEVWLFNFHDLEVTYKLCASILKRLFGCTKHLLFHLLIENK